MQFCKENGLFQNNFIYIFLNQSELCWLLLEVIRDVSKLPVMTWRVTAGQGRPSATTMFYFSQCLAPVHAWQATTFAFSGQKLFSVLGAVSLWQLTFTECFLYTWYLTKHFMFVILWYFCPILQIRKLKQRAYVFISFGCCDKWPQNFSALKRQ
jgi:hypothetical protein